MLLHVCGATFVSARVLHAIGLGRSSGASWPRMAGTTLTVLVIATLAVTDIAAFFR